MGNGYAYSSKHISYEDAVEEVDRKARVFRPNVGQHISSLKQVITTRTLGIGNAVLIGLSSHFFRTSRSNCYRCWYYQQARTTMRTICKFVYSSIYKNTYNDKNSTLMFNQVCCLFVRLHYVNCRR